MNIDYSAYEGFKVKGYTETVLSRGKVVIEKGELCRPSPVMAPSSSGARMADITPTLTPIWCATCWRRALLLVRRGVGCPGGPLKDDGGNGREARGSRWTRYRRNNWGRRRRAVVRRAGRRGHRHRAPRCRLCGRRHHAGRHPSHFRDQATLLRKAVGHVRQLASEPRDLSHGRRNGTAWSGNWSSRREIPFSVVAPFRTDHPLLAGVDPFVMANSSKGGTLDMLLNAGQFHEAIVDGVVERGAAVFGSSANFRSPAANIATKTSSLPIREAAAVSFRLRSVQVCAHGRPFQQHYRFHRLLRRPCRPLFRTLDARVCERASA